MPIWTHWRPSWPDRSFFPQTASSPILGPMTDSSRGDQVQAQLWLRLKAFMFDYLLILGYLVALAVVGVLLRLGPLGGDWSELLSTPLRKDLLAFLTSVLQVVTYFAWNEGSAAGATWGKRQVSLKVVGLDGQPLGRGQALVRAAVKFIPWQMAHTALFHIPGFPMATGDPPDWTVWLLGGMWVVVAVYLVGLTRLGGGRTIYDRLSGSQVISE